jgi:hypothetical protein
MLDRLYTLYVTVITTIKGYGDYFWVDVVEKVDEMGEQVGAQAYEASYMTGLMQGGTAQTILPAATRLASQGILGAPPALLPS